MMAEPVDDLLFVELLGGFGDLLLALPALDALARSHPAARLRVLTFAPGADLLAADPRLHRVVALRDHRGSAVRAALCAELDRLRPDLVVTTTRHSGIPDLLAHRGVPAVDDLWRHPPGNEPVDARFVRLLALHGAIAPDLVDARPPRRTGLVRLTGAERAEGRALLAVLVADADAAGLGRVGGPPVVLIPDAGMAVKRWPWHRWRALATLLADAGHPVLCLSPGSGLLAGAVPALGLRPLAALFTAVAERDGIAVGGDTGPTRLAAAMGARAVGLYGPTSAARYGLHLPGTVNLQGLPGCPVRRPADITRQTCWWDAYCPLDPAGPACLADLTVGRVADAVHEVASR